MSKTNVFLINIKILDSYKKVDEKINASYKLQERELLVSTISPTL